ncbi:ABC transporter permease [Methylovirgula sp. 4M-Z18]|uniref:ABC transporter permease n=1 Tax=Methylovirgula sp. 4M-Z18 TaxID=2293567 RepID=UPI000E2EB703|nr:ABC transporter permease [Methylovirgula sp. 4M-Z18]RFB78904.1 ABC transporter permease [Methylovirgula sp. 4M-Z18]
MSVQDKAAKKASARLDILLGLTLVGLLLLMWLFLAVTVPQSFLQWNNFANILRQGSMVAILALGQTFVIITGGIDLSVGAVEGFCSLIIALMLQNGWPVWLAIAGTLGIGLAIGMFHAFGVVQLGLPPFIMTLATLTAIRGFGQLITSASISITDDNFTGFAVGDFLTIPNLFWLVVLVAVPGYFFLHQSRWGRYLFAIGSNKEAARLSGVKVQRITYIAYMLSSLCAAFVGVMLAMRLGIGSFFQGEGDELKSIASSVIGGTSLFGAVGSIHGPLLGSFILTTINNGANLLGINNAWQKVITGGLIIVIVYFDNLRRRKN